MKHRLALPIAVVLGIAVFADSNAKPANNSFALPVQMVESQQQEASTEPSSSTTTTTNAIEPSPTPTVSATTENPVSDQSKNAKVSFTPSLPREVEILTGTYEWGSATRIDTEQLQNLLGISVDGHYGRKTLEAHAAALQFLGLPTNELPSPPKPGRRFPEASRCHEIESLASEVGWPADEIRTVSYVAYRESRCIPTAYNGKGRDRSYGLVQINTKGSLWEHRRDLCGLNEREDLFVPAVNLSCAHKLWLRSGWAPWNL